jgi:hypothetical protein
MIFPSPSSASSVFDKTLLSLTRLWFRMLQTSRTVRKKNAKPCMKLITVTKAGDVAVRDAHASADYSHLSLSPTGAQSQRISLAPRRN